MVDLPYRETFANYQCEEERARKVPFIEIQYNDKKDTFVITMMIGNEDRFVCYVFGADEFLGHG